MDSSGGDLVSIELIVFMVGFIWFTALALTSRKDHEYREFTERIRDDIWSGRK